jgi:tetraacyldisaccharide-1-P 4'-kinase
MQKSRAEIEACSDAQIWLSNHVPRRLRDEKTGADEKLSFLKRRDIKAFAGLADNAQFYDSLHELGAGYITRLKQERGDHHVWKKTDFSWFQNAPAINAHQNEIFAAQPTITTEKDAVKLDSAWFDGPLFSLCIELEIEAQNAFMALIRSNLGVAPSASI